MTDQVLRSEDIDRLGQALITLTKELWVMKDRQCILEAALADAGVLEHGAIDRYQPDDALQSNLDNARKQLIDGLIGGLVGDPTESSR
jgi:hypothetical protein